jgi:hypothetical protein
MFDYLNNMFDSLNLFIFFVINNFNSLNITSVINFIIINYILFLILIFIYLGILLDKRFKLKNKILILVIFILYILLILVLKGSNSLLINDIF